MRPLESGEISIGQAARILGLNKSTVRQAVQRRTIVSSANRRCRCSLAKHYLGRVPQSTPKWVAMPGLSVNVYCNSR
ncbi:hypothetical protein GHK34_27125 [Sinorhizobium meliloti]|nr:hypothetical protein [Sinorhizobium meliloti]MQU86387.1 hypothetical protein [Sinorhizobium meliloti]